MVVVVLPLQVPYASPYHVAEHTSEYFHNNEYHHDLTAYRLVGAEICRNYRGDAHQCHDRRYMSDGCHDEVDDKSKRYNLVKHYGLFKPCRPLHCHVHYAGAFDQLCHDAKRRYGDPQRHALHQIEHKNDSRRHPQKGRQCDSATSQRPISPTMCIGTPNTNTDKQSMRNVIRHSRCCQLWLRWSRNEVSRCMSFNFIVNVLFSAKLPFFNLFHAILPLFLHAFTFIYGCRFLVERRF